LEVLSKRLSIYTEISPSRILIPILRRKAETLIAVDFPAFARQVEETLKIVAGFRKKIPD